MPKEYKVTCAKPGVNRTRYTDDGDVTFKDSVAICNKKQAQFLVAKGYHCEALGAVPEEKPDVEAQLAEATAKIEELTEALKKAQNEAVDFKTKLDEATAKIKELEAKVAASGDTDKKGNK